MIISAFTVIGNNIGDNMTKELCDICKEKLATAKCFICGKDICDEHNSKVTIDAAVYNENIFSVYIADKLLDCCSDCTDILKIMMKEERKIIEDRFRENLIQTKSWLLDIARKYKK